jgi:hypothetical protein
VSLLNHVAHVIASADGSLGAFFIVPYERMTQREIPFYATFRLLQEKSSLPIGKVAARAARPSRL